MSRWIAMHCGDEAEALQAQHPNAFLLLCQIARRAKWKDCRITKMKKGEALIGDWKEAGIHSQMAYRIAKQTLADCGLATFQGTNKGTRAILISTTIFSLTSPINNDPENETGNNPTTNKERSSNDPTTTNHTDTQSTQNTQNTQNTQTPFALNGASSDSALAISWNASDGFTGVSDTDRQAWAEAYPAVNITQQLAAASEWLKSNPAKRKKNHRRFITSWFSRHQERGGDIRANKPEIKLDLGGRQPKAIRGIPAQAEGRSESPATGDSSLPDFGQPSVRDLVALYPKRHRVAEAEKALEAHVSKGTDLDAVAAGTRAIAAIIQRMPGGCENIYVPSALTFFQNRRWEDDPKTWLRNAGKNGAPIEELQLGGRRPARTIEIQLPPSKP